MSRFPQAKVSAEDDINAYIGQRLKVRRQTLGLTLEDIYTKTGISKQMCSKYERGVTQISPNELMLLTRLLEIPVDLLFPANPNALSNHKPADVSVFPSIARSHSLHNVDLDLFSRKETRELIAVFYKLPTNQLRRTIITLLRIIATDLINLPLARP